ncbi:hypothetical protein ATZ99_13820 [Thermovenabulum gondwanense]|uniref:Nuclease SbcCD subunit C n=1 Tax=Thermovenabulum gondwanense TaxID=520767 RepID=A0A161QAR9_9FIRM|nr:AAA family ATPase [Thermovenabulum gondwanense]KYO65744.1 hypothetical protein ATZ99_13820 [Thermovenabulum gondwanense]
MSKILSLEIENFQSHKKTKIEFDDGMTVILGPTDQGKSSIIRALKWVLYNEPRGSDFISVGENFCRVKLTLEDNTQIIREKGVNRNRYILIKNGEEMVFEGFGNTIPQEIYKAHGIPKIKIDKDAISFANLSEQLEGPFLLSENPATRARILGKLAGIHVLDAALKITNKELNDYNFKEKIVLQKLEELNNRLNEYKDLYEVKYKLDIAKNLIEFLKVKLSSLKNLMSIKEKFQYISEEEYNINLLLKSLQTVEGAEELTKTAAKKTLSFKQLFNLYQKLIELELQKLSIQKVLNDTKNVLIAERIFIETNDKIQKYKKLKDFSLKLNKLEKERLLILSIMEKTKDVNKSEEFYTKAEENLKKYKDLLDIKNKIVNLSKNIKQLEQKANNFKDIFKIEEYLKQLDNKKTLLEKLKTLKEELIANQNNINETLRYSEKIEDYLTKESHKYVFLMKKLSKCPICFSILDEKQVEKIAAEILSKGGND